MPKCPYKTNLIDDVLVIVVSQCTRKFVVVHVRLRLSTTPQLRNRLSIQELKKQALYLIFKTIMIQKFLKFSQLELVHSDHSTKHIF